MDKIVDNFEVLGRKLIPVFKDFRDDDDFWVVQIIKRRKDNPGLPRNEKLIDTFYIHGRGQLEDMKEQIIQLCEVNNARAYLFVNRRNYKKASLQMMKRLAEAIAEGNYKFCRGAFKKTIGQCHSELFKNWVVDVDPGHDMAYIMNIINELYQKSGEGAINILVPTANGSHLICSPFDLLKFQQACPGVDVGKNDVTLLYFKKIDNEETANRVLNECCIL